MKSKKQQMADKAKAITELLLEQAKCLVIAFDVNKPKKERVIAATRAMIIKECEIPIILAQPLQIKEYPKGGMIRECGPEFIMKTE